MTQNKLSIYCPDTGRLLFLFVGGSEVHESCYLSIEELIEDI